MMYDGNRSKTGRYFAVVVALAVIGFGAAGANAAPNSGSGGSSDTGSGGTGSFGTGSFGGGPGQSAPPTQHCNQSTKSGGAGVTETIHQLGRSGPTSFVLSYETENIPDMIQVFYEGAQVLNTGYVGDDINEGTGSARVTLPAGTATSVTVRVTGPADTVWSYVVHCPA
ncbi:hypothetical protein ACWDSJ_18540 [Nocardia sp. NPDC003482]